MKIHSDHIKALIESNLQNSTALVTGEDGRHFSATVISEAFAQKTRVEKQKLVYATLQQSIDEGAIHAISIKTFTPEEWQSQTWTN